MSVNAGHVAGHTLLPDIVAPGNNLSYRVELVGEMRRKPVTAVAHVYNNIVAPGILVCGGALPYMGNNHCAACGRIGHVIVVYGVNTAMIAATRVLWIARRFVNRRLVGDTLRIYRHLITPRKSR